MKINILFILISLSFFFSVQASEPKDSTLIKINSFIEKYNRYSKLFPQEKVYMHFDNSDYFIGENMWFKAYVVMAGENNLSPLSTTLYVELVAPEGRILETQKLKIIGGQADGCFVLDKPLYGGFYEVRAYTRLMLNQDKEYLFSRVFPFYEKVQENGDYTKNLRPLPNSLRVPGERKEFIQKQKVELSFFPEGGNLIAGLTSDVAFKATGKYGENLQVQGNIEDADGNIITSLATAYQGMGRFKFTPQKGNYIAKVAYGKKTYTFNLPEILPMGYVIHVEHAENSILVVRIQKSPGLPDDTLGIVISCRGKLYVSDDVVFTNNAKEFSIPDTLLPTGISQITLFNQNGNVLSERMVFINHQDQLSISVTQDKTAYNPYEQVNLDFQIKDVKERPANTYFSLAVRDGANSIHNAYGESALTCLLLSSELKGYIENPGYYFESNSQERSNALDLLMLTQGWSRYVWTKMINVDKEFMNNPIEKCLVVEGKVLIPKRKSKHKEGIDVRMVLNLPDNKVQQGSCVTDSSGEFNFAVPDFCGNTNLVLQTKKGDKTKSNGIILNRFFSPGFKTYDYTETQLLATEIISPDSIEQNVKTDSITESETGIDDESNLPIDQRMNKINEIMVEAKKKFRFEGSGLSSATIAYDVQETTQEMIDKENYEPVDLFEYLMKINRYFNYDINSDEAYYKRKRVIFILNNISTVMDPLAYGELKSLAVADIETVTIDERTNVCLYLPTELCSNSIPNMMIIHVYTNQKYVQGRFRPTPGVRCTIYKGYTCAKEFYSPDYSQKYLPEEADFRRTLYWNPYVKTDEEGKVKVTFYNNSTCKKLDISAETVTVTGEIGVLK
jgi:hypothetical protein